MLHIVRALLDGPRGFNELGREAGGCNPSTLAQRLTRLEELGLVRKRAEPECTRGTYTLTEAGAGLSEVLDAIEFWASRHLAEAPRRGPAAAVEPGDAPGHDGTLRLRPGRDDGMAPMNAPRRAPQALAARGTAPLGLHDSEPAPRSEPPATPATAVVDGLRLEGSRIELDRSVLHRAERAATPRAVPARASGAIAPDDPGGDAADGGNAPQP